MAIQVTNTIAASALQGEDATATLTWAQMNAFLPNLVVGAKVVVSSSGNVGYISEVPINGDIFLIKPLDPSKRMDSNTPGVLQANEILTVG